MPHPTPDLPLDPPTDITLAVDDVVGIHAEYEDYLGTVKAVNAATKRVRVRFYDHILNEIRELCFDAEQVYIIRKAAAAEATAA